MGNDPSFFKGDNLPVEQVSRGECVKFRERFSDKKSVTYRLPTEAEWEHACRVEDTGEDGFINCRCNYPDSAMAWSETPDESSIEGLSI